MEFNMEYNSLWDMITYLQYGTKLHIGVLFFGNYGNEKCALPHKQTIHASRICDEFKSCAGGFERCFRCRNAAIRKAHCTKVAFGDLCINGVYEYTRPVVIGKDVACIIYIGNILEETKGYEKLKKNLTDNGYQLIGNEPLKITIKTKPYGYTGIELNALLKEYGIMNEFYDPDYLVMMLSIESGLESLQKIERVLTSIPKKPAINHLAPRIEKAKQVVSVNKHYYPPCKCYP